MNILTFIAYSFYFAKRNNLDYVMKVGIVRKKGIDSMRKILRYRVVIVEQSEAIVVYNRNARGGFVRGRAWGALRSFLKCMILPITI